MAGLKINICFWYLEDSLIDSINKLLIEEHFEPSYLYCRDINKLQRQFDSENIDLIMADFDLPDTLRGAIENIHRRFASHIPLIYLVGPKNEAKAAESLKKGVWDYLQKDNLVKLVSTVYSSQKYGKVMKYNLKVTDEKKESEDRYRSIFNTVKDGIILLDPDTFSVLDFNESIFRMFMIPDDYDYQQVIEWMENERSAYCRKDMEEVARGLETDLAVTYLCLNSRHDGSEFWSENTLSRFSSGERKHFVMVIRNIQEQKLMEESLKQSREHFRNLAENSPDIIMRFDKNFRHLYVNQTAQVQLGIPVEDFLNKSHDEMGIFESDMVKFWEGAIDKVFKNSYANTVEFDFKAPRRTFTFEWRLFPEFGEKDEVETVLAIARDITDSKAASKVIKRSEERLKLAVEATNLGLWDWNMETDEVFYSPFFFSMLGYDENELPQELDTWYSLIYHEDLEMSKQAMQTAISSRKGFELEFRLLCKDGSYKWISSRGHITDKDNRGRSKRLIGTHEDISERKRNEEVQRTLVNISNAVNTTTNLDELYEKIREYLGSIVDTTNCFLALYNEDTKMLSMPFHRDEKDSFSEFPVGKTFTGFVISTGKTELIDAERERKLTEEGLIEAFGAPCVSWLGVPLKRNDRTIGVFVVQSYREDIIYTEKDVSILEFVSDQIALAIERKRDQDNIRENQERQRRIFESSPDPIVVVNPDGIIVDYNTGLLSTFRITNEPVIGQNVFHFIDKAFWKAALLSFKKTWEVGYIKNLEFIIKRADGSSFLTEVSTGSIYTNDGKPESMVIIFKDITERKETERRLLEAKEKAEESDRLKTAFLSNMSHEIRTPMNAIVGFSDLLNDPELSVKERSEFIAQINLGADNLMHLIDDIIDIAKIEAGQIKINRRDMNLRQLIDELLVMFRQTMERMDKNGIDLRLRWKYPEEDLVFESDPFRVKQVITNLLNNAIKFTDEGFIEIGVEKVADMVRIYVRDTGIGIDSDKKEVIFDRFMQGHRSNTRLYGGTGLGLAISKNLCELLGGDIGVMTKSGLGSEFWFRLPLKEAEISTQVQNIINHRIDKDWSGKKILIAEDDSSNFYLISEVLKQTRAEVIWAKDGIQAIELYKQYKEQLNLVLLDIQMPERDGYECARIIKKESPHLPVIAQTAYAMSGERELSLEAGCDDYISKPLQVNFLIEKLGIFLV